MAPTYDGTMCSDVSVIVRRIDAQGMKHKGHAVFLAKPGKSISRSRD